MMPLKKFSIFAVSIVVFILVFSNTSLLSYISHNGSGSGYGEGDGAQGAAVQNACIEYYIIQGAGYYLKGHSLIQDFLNRVEWQDLNGVDFPEFQRLIDAALDNIVMARFYYETLVEIAMVTPYNPLVTGQLKTFDFYTFMKDNGLNETVFKKLAGYLSHGDITGTYKHVLGDIKVIEGLLTSLKSDLVIQRLPPLEMAWKLNELCAEVSLFGSYSARVFDHINQK